VVSTEGRRWWRDKAGRQGDASLNFQAKTFEDDHPSPTIPVHKQLDNISSPAMAPELSSNWKKLQASLKQESTNSKSLKRKPEPTERQQNSSAKRKRIEAQHTGIPVPSSWKRSRMGIGSSAVEEPEEPVPSASLAMWAEDNDLSAADLAEAYSVGLQNISIQGASADRINAGLSAEVEVGDYVAMDCEMVGVGGQENRSVLARVSVVNFQGIQVYDSFVRPKEFVTNWRTHVSGVSSKNMSTARPFDEVRNEVAELLKDRILVGHAIKHDLDVMMLGHPERDIRDTSRFSGFRKYNAGKTPSLKKLAKEVLGMEIQKGQHSSIEDARATMLLFRRHKQAFDSKIASRFPPQKINGGEERSKQKRKKKNKR
jgi:RNA exonuclease 4